MNFFFPQSMPSCEEELMPFNMTGNIRSSLSCSIRLRVMASVLLPQSPGTIWVGLGSVALTGTAGGGRAPAADRLQCSGDRLMWHWATAGLQQRVSGALLFWHLDDVCILSAAQWHSETLRLLLDYPPLILYRCFQRSENLYNKAN